MSTIVIKKTTVVVKRVLARGDDAYGHGCDRHGIGDIRRRSKLTMLSLVVLVEVSMKSREDWGAISQNLVFVQFLSRRQNACLPL